MSDLLLRQVIFWILARLLLDDTPIEINPADLKILKLDTAAVLGLMCGYGSSDPARDLELSCEASL